LKVWMEDEVRIGVGKEFHNLGADELLFDESSKHNYAA
jgi:hypothetical protein